MSKKISYLSVVIGLLVYFACQTPTGSSSSSSGTTGGGTSSAASSAPFVAPITGLVTSVPATTVTAISIASGSYLPASNATGVNVDTLLRIGFDTAPTINTTGTITIRKVSDDSVVDTINLADVAVTNATTFQTLTLATANTKINVLANTTGSGTAYPDQVRIDNYYPITVDGATLKIILHNNKLAYNTAYYVLIDNGAITGNISSSAFTGITDKTTWQFTTKTAASVSGTTISVDSNGGGDFSTIQGAIDYIPASNTTAYIINIANGIYEELLYSRNKSNITFKGANQSNTIIQYDNYDSYNNGTGSGTTANTTTGLASSTTFARGGRSIYLISGGTGIVFDTLTIKSTHAQGSAANNQAETIYYNSTSGQLIAKNCNFIGYQDTLQLKGFTWFYNCYISGDVDFMWGANNTSLFERCEIKSRYNANGGYLVQARSVANYGGFIFLNCDLTKESSVVDNSIYLARSTTTSGAAGSYYDNVTFISCKMDSHIKTIGFLLPATILATNPSSSSPVAGWREYQSFNSSGLLDASGRGATNGTTAIVGNPYSSSTPLALGSIQLSTANYTTFYSNRASIFAQSTTDGTYTLTGVTGGWNPIP